MGDAAFLILAIEPSTGLLIFSLGIVVGSITGYFVDFHGTKFMLPKSKINIEYEKIKKTFVSKFNIFWILLFIPGFVIGILTAFQIEFTSDIYNSIFILLGSSGAILSIFMWSLEIL